MPKYYKNNNKRFDSPYDRKPQPWTTEHCRNYYMLTCHPYRDDNAPDRRQLAHGIQPDHFVPHIEEQPVSLKRARGLPAIARYVQKGTDDPAFVKMMRQVQYVLDHVYEYVLVYEPYEDDYEPCPHLHAIFRSARHMGKMIKVSIETAKRATGYKMHFNAMNNPIADPYRQCRYLQKGQGIEGDLPFSQFIGASSDDMLQMYAAAELERYGPPKELKGVYDHDKWYVNRLKSVETRAIDSPKGIMRNYIQWMGIKQYAYWGPNKTCKVLGTYLLRYAQDIDVTIKMVDALKAGKGRDTGTLMRSFFGLLDEPPDDDDDDETPSTTTTQEFDYDDWFKGQ